MAKRINRKAPPHTLAPDSRSEPGAPGHDEWLIDESLEETFPASDSTLPSHPGSTLATRYPGRDEETGTRDGKIGGTPRRSTRFAELRRLGFADLRISALGLGSWVIGGPRGASGRGLQDDDESIAAIHRALDNGINWIDTAPAYGMGHAEEVIAKALRGWSGSRPYVFTKCGLRWNERGELHRVLNKESIREECEASLRRLQTDAIDLYLIHRAVEDPAENLEGWETLAALHKEGKVRWIGVSNWNMEQMRAAQNIAPIAAVEPPYSLVKRDIEQEILPYCAQHHIGVIVYSPLASGLISGRMTRERALHLPSDDARRKIADFQEPRLSKILQLADKLQEMASRYGHSAAEIAIAWTLRLPSVTGAVVGARSAEQIEEAIGAMDVRLAEEDILSLQQLAETV